jgi:hypothetical protein
LPERPGGGVVQLVAITLVQSPAAIARELRPVIAAIIDDLDRWLA